METIVTVLGAAVLIAGVIGVLMLSNDPDGGGDLRKVRARRKAQREMFADWCPQLVRAVKSGAKVKPCEHLSDVRVMQVNAIVKKRDQDYRMSRIKAMIDENGLPGAQPKPRVGGASDDEYNDDRSKRQIDRDWYGYDGRNADLDWRDRTQAQSWGMDADTYRSNWLEND